MGSSENGDETFGCFVKSQTRFISAKRSREHGQKVCSNTPNTPEDLGENGLIKLTNHDGQSHEPIKVVGVSEQLIIVNTSGKGWPFILNPHIFNSVVMVIAT